MRKSWTQLNIRPSGQLLGRCPEGAPGTLTHAQVGNVPDLNDGPSPAAHPKWNTSRDRG
ncbi:hypothetical protein NicSoilC12_25850 [Arthrobacter sp. NicSoilC12]|nr:hypothetical protein NicSoilC12_25850 [Arthrobacter sp. NicSoilC12]